MRAPSRPRLLRVILWTLLGVALLLTFRLYGRPGVVFDLTTRIWSCI